MCCKEDCHCQHPAKGRETADCTPEQIQQCHGNVDEHPCTNKETDN